MCNDMRDLVDGNGQGQRTGQLAIEVFCYRMKKYIGSYAAAMGGVDVLVFTAGMGENSPIIRRLSCEGMEFLGIQVDPALNEASQPKERLISPEGARVKVLIVPTNEELVIAEDTERIVNEMKK